jgi:hypothetical protein
MVEHTSLTRTDSAGRTADDTGVPTTAPNETELPAAGEQPPSRRPHRSVLIAALVVAMALLGLLALVVWLANEADDTATEPTTTEVPTTVAPTTAPPSSDTEPATTAPSVTVPVDASTAVFPDAASGTRFADPVDAARAFAVDFVGFTDPLIGEFMQGDARSGEVEVRPMANGPATTVFVRQLGTDGTWWVLGSATANITADAPDAGDAITSPVTVSGTALAFEGNVAVEVRQDGRRSPLGSGFVTGGGDVPRPFTGEVAYTPPTTEHGAVLFLTRSEEDGRVWEAAVVRVAFS